MGVEGAIGRGIARYNWSKRGFKKHGGSKGQEITQIKKADIIARISKIRKSTRSLTIKYLPEGILIRSISLCTNTNNMVKLKFSLCIDNTLCKRHRPSNKKAKIGQESPLYCCCSGLFKRFQIFWLSARVARYVPVAEDTTCFRHKAKRYWAGTDSKALLLMTSYHGSIQGQPTVLPSLLWHWCWTSGISQ